MTDHSNNGNHPDRPYTPLIPGQRPAAPPQHAPQQQGQLSPQQIPQGYVSPQQQADNQNYQHYEPHDASQQYQPVIQPDGGHGNGGPQKPAKFLKTKKRPSRFLRFMQLGMSLVFFAAIGLAAFVMYARLQLDKPGPLAQKTIFEVSKGQGLSTIAEGLQKQGIIRNKRLFKLNPATLQVAKKLKAGKFAIPEKASMQDVLDILVRGRAVFYKVTIPEGLTSQQAVAILKNHPQLSGSISAIPPEGSLMPNTYQFDAGANRSDILIKMSKSQQEFITKYWPQRQKDLPFKTPQEALILASIVEKETGISSERKRVAGVFVNRLKKGIKLQSDPTIIYGLVGGQGKLGHPLLRSEMKKKTGYNTYQIAGLPPTPIANPGRKAIEAVLNPADTKDLFFVADGSGGHAFAPTLKLHNKNVRKWREIEAKRRAEKKRREAEEKRLAALEEKLKSQVKPLPGVTVSTPDAKVPPALPGAAIIDPASKKLVKGQWHNNIPLPSRKPAR